MTHGHSNARGFTLLEMLVALAVFSLAALALIRLQAFSTRNAAEIELRVIAQSVVRNRAVELLTQPQPPALGTSRGTENNGGIDWRWQQEAELTDDSRFVQIAITAQDSNGRTSAGLTVMRRSGPLVDEEEVAPDEDFGGES